MKRILVAGLAALLLAAGHASAQSSYGPGDVAQMPPHCLAKLKLDPRYTEAAFAPRFGEYWIHLHHYCHGLKWANRARQSVDRRTRAGTLGMAKGEYQYAARAAGAGFWMRPQIYVELGHVHLGLGELGEAGRLFAEAIGASPGYLAAYLGLIDVHRRSESRAAALEVATAGLRQIPDAQPLQKAYLEFGGNKPFPAPARAQAPRSAPPSPAEPQAEPTAGQEAVEPDRAQDDSAASSATDAPGATDATDAAGARRATDVSESSGRACRFCPPEAIEQRWRDSFGQPAKNPEGN